MKEHVTTWLPKKKKKTSTTPGERIKKKGHQWDEKKGACDTERLHSSAVKIYQSKENMTCRSEGQTQTSCALAFYTQWVHEVGVGACSPCVCIPSIYDSSILIVFSHHKTSECMHLCRLALNRKKVFWINLWVSYQVLPAFILCFSINKR